MSGEPTKFSEAREQLEELVKQVRAKDTSLEKSLDLFDEAIKVGNSAFELIDQVDFSQDELTSTSSSDDDRETTTQQVEVVEEVDVVAEDNEDVVDGADSGVAEDDDSVTEDDDTDTHESN